MVSSIWIRSMSEMINLHFSNPGIYTSIQDNGRPRLQSYGVPIGGYIDHLAANMANWIVGNPFDSPVLEITLSGPKINISSNCQIAITGADMNPKINGNPIAMYETVNAAAESELSFGKLVNGCRSYLAVNGDWELDKWLDSYSATVFENREFELINRIKKGKVLRIRPGSKVSAKSVPLDFRPKIVHNPVVRVLPGPEYPLFDNKAVNDFMNLEHFISTDSNRMGYRLNSRIHPIPEDEIISSGIIPGTIQITHSGQPIVLLADAQTTGGYPRIANIISVDLHKMGQLKPSDSIRFKKVSLKEAQELHSGYLNQLKAILS